jgi:integrase
MGNKPDEWIALGDAKIITPEEVGLILQRAKEAGDMDPMYQRDYEWMAVAVNTGLRLSEVGHIEKDDVLPTRLMMTRRKKRHLQAAPIEVMPAVMEILRKRAATVESGYIFPGRAQPCIIHRSKTVRKEGQPNVITKWDEQVCIGGHASLRSIQRRWRLLLTELDLYKYGRGIHSLRHTAITSIYRMTKDLRKAQVFAGHSSSKITEVYAHVVDLQESLNVMKPLI